MRTVKVTIKDKSGKELSTIEASQFETLDEATTAEGTDGVLKLVNSAFRNKQRAAEAAKFATASLDKQIRAIMKADKKDNGGKLSANGRAKINELLASAE